MSKKEKKQNPEPQGSGLIDQRKIRLEKVAQLREMGINPYPSKADRTHKATEIHENFGKLEGKQVTVVGRAMSWRGHGHIVFSDLQDQSGKIQLYIKEDEIAETNPEERNLGFADLNLVDIGDFLECTGTVTKTQRGEISVLAQKLKIAAKTIRPLPEKWLGITDKEERYRRRYLDMTMNPEVRQIFERKAKFWKAIRDFLDGRGFVEINTPILEHVTGGADANPFVTHYDALDQDFYLRISHELPLKKLLGAGFEKVYDIGARFRNEGFSDEHLPEHLAMEWYWAYADYRDGMELTVEMYRHILQEVYDTQVFKIKDFEVDLSKEWEELDYTTIIKERFGVDVFNTTVAEIEPILRQNGADIEDDLNLSRAVDALWKIIRKTVEGPAFLTGVPKFLSPLSKTNAKDPRLTDRFQPILAGSELGNAFGELNDPVDQFERFMEQQAMRDAGDNEAHMLDIDFVEMLEYGMPPAVGFGLTDRVFWYFEGVTAKEGVPLPPVKKHVDTLTKKIYPEVKFEAEEKPTRRKKQKG